jgi:long-subunit acyl-CoA synthetase (AMP-forming)
MSSLPQLLSLRAASTPSKVALRYRHHGIWEEISFGDYAKRADQAGVGLQSVGVSAGDRVGIVMENTPEWLYFLLGAQSIGATVVVVRPDTSPGYLAARLSENEVTTVVLGDQEQFDKVQEERNTGSLTSVRNLVVVDTRGMRAYDMPGRNVSDGVHSWARMVDSEGSLANITARASTLNDAAEAVRIVPLDGAAIARTHADLADLAAATASSYAVKAGDESMAVSSFANEESFCLDVAAPLHTPMIVNIGHDPALVLSELREVRPTLMVAPAGVVERVKSDADRRAAGTKGLKRAAYQASLRRGDSRLASGKARTNDLPILLFVSIAVGIIALIVSNKLSSGWWIMSVGWVKLLAPILIGVVFALGAALGGFAAARPVRNRYGLGRLRSLVSENTVLDETRDWYVRLGVPLALGTLALGSGTTEVTTGAVATGGVTKAGATTAEAVASEGVSK